MSRSIPRRRSLSLVLVLLLSTVAAAPAATAQSQSVATQVTPVDCSYPMTVEDATGTEVTVESEPEDVVVLAPSAAQTMWAIGAKDKVVGMPVNQYTDYLNGTDSRTDVVNSALQPKTETIVGLEPDLVLAPNILDNETVESLRDRGLTVYRFDSAGTLADVYDKTRLTGRLVGEYDNASRTSARMRAEVDAIQGAVEGQERPDVYYVMAGGFTAGPGSYIHELITVAGGHNIGADANITFYGEISQEVVAAEDPEYIVVNENVEVPDNAATNNSTAVREGQIVRVNQDYLNQPGPRNVIPLRKMASAFHPDAYAEAETTDVTVSGVSTCAQTTGGGEGTTGETTTAVSGPGFGVGVALLALLAGALVFGRRD
jgi:iron complex transport system substrate-binding protein